MTTEKRPSVLPIALILAVLAGVMVAKGQINVGAPVAPVQIMPATPWVTTAANQFTVIDSSGNKVVSIPTGTGLELAANRSIVWSATNDSTAAVDTVISRTGAGVISIGAATTTFATLGTPANGSITYCTDCTVTTAASCPGTQASCICANSGTGAFARRAAGAWYCTF